MSVSHVSYMLAKRSLLSFIYLQLEFPKLPASSAPSPGVSFTEFNKHSAWPSQQCPSLPTACHVNLVLCKWLLYSSPLSLKDD